MKTITLTTLIILTVSTVYAAKDERIPIDLTSAEYKQLNAIGAFQREDRKGYGTGFLVDDCHVLTNSHSAFETFSGQIGAKSYFSVGQTGSKNTPFTYANIEGKVIAQNGFDGTVSSINNDWAVIRLSQSIGKQVGSIPIYQMDPARLQGKGVITAGYPANLTENGKDMSKMYADLNCKFLGMSVYGFEYHTCQSSDGQSGSPVMSKGNDNKYYALGMISGGDKFPMDRNEDPNKANFAVNFGSGKAVDVVSDGDMIVEAIKADPCD